MVDEADDVQLARIAAELRARFGARARSVAREQAIEAERTGSAARSHWRRIAALLEE